MLSGGVVLNLADCSAAGCAKLPPFPLSPCGPTGPTVSPVDSSRTMSFGSHGDKTGQTYPSPLVSSLPFLSFPFPPPSSSSSSPLSYRAYQVAEQPPPARLNESWRSLPLALMSLHAPLGALPLQSTVEAERYPIPDSAESPVSIRFLVRFDFESTQKSPRFGFVSCLVAKASPPLPFAVPLLLSPLVACSSLLCSAPPCSAPPCSAPPCSAPPCSAPPCSAPPCSAPPCSAPPCSAPPCSAPPCSAPPCSAPPCSAPPCSAPPCSAPPCSAPPCSAPPCSAPPCSAPPCSAPPCSVPPCSAPPCSAPPCSAPPCPALPCPALGPLLSVPSPPSFSVAGVRFAVVGVYMLLGVSFRGSLPCAIREAQAVAMARVVRRLLLRGEEVVVMGTFNDLDGDLSADLDVENLDPVSRVMQIIKDATSERLINIAAALPSEKRQLAAQQTNFILISQHLTDAISVEMPHVEAFFVTLFGLTLSMYNHSVGIAAAAAAEGSADSSSRVGAGENGASVDGENGSGESSSQESSGLSGGAVAAIVFFVIIGLAIGAAAAFWWLGGAKLLQKESFKRKGMSMFVVGAGKHWKLGKKKGHGAGGGVGGDGDVGSESGELAKEEGVGYSGENSGKDGDAAGIKPKKKSFMSGYKVWKPMDASRFVPSRPVMAPPFQSFLTSQPGSPIIDNPVPLSRRAGWDDNDDDDDDDNWSPPRFALLEPRTGLREYSQ
ncbi:unnamed protein product [Closterium sp. Yama58-4]|nr:unnamed protein product [Closterium sp. Yama58-4]